MATMVKEKRREKKKSKEKPAIRIADVQEDEPSSSLLSVPPVLGEAPQTQVSNELSDTKTDTNNEADQSEMVITQDSMIHSETPTQSIDESNKEGSNLKDKFENKEADSLLKSSLNPQKTTKPKLLEIDSYEHLNTRLERMAIPEESHIEDTRIKELENEDAYLSVQNSEFTIDNVEPSAPMFEEEVAVEPRVAPVDISSYIKPKLQCMPLDEAIRLYGGSEMAAVKNMSEREEAIVEAGPMSGPEHPLVDLLSTFRHSLIAVERERSRLANGFSEEEKSRVTLWKIEKRNIYKSQECACGASVNLTVKFDHATLIKERLPVAKLKLEGLLRDVQECFCHHQQEALLAHSQIEELVTEVVQSNKNYIREALSLVLQALRLSDGAPEALPAALQRWAAVLAGALVDGRDLRHLLFLLHHLFRQSRSVQWAVSVVTARVTDSVTAARTLALLDILLAKLRIEPALECIEEGDESWEEVGVRGSGGAVSSGALRERDLTALLRALPLQSLIARLVLFSQADFRQATESEWGDSSGGNGVLKACCGVRALLAILERAVTLHSAYERLHQVLRTVARSAMTSLACLYHTARSPYAKELEVKIAAELEAAFAAGFTLFGTRELHTLPTSLLTADTAKDYCIAFILGLHDETPKRIEMLSVEAPVLPCSERVRILTHAATGRERDPELARIVLGFLLQTGLKRKSVPCIGGCEARSRECIPLVVSAHPYLHSVALHTVADLSQVESLEPSTVDTLHVHKWRGSVEEMGAILSDWAQRCPNMLPKLLLQLDTTPLTGLSLPVQLYIAEWLRAWSKSPGNLEVAWRVLLRLNVHRVSWLSCGDLVPPSAAPPTDAFSTAHAVLCGEWGHSIPLICSEGIPALCTLCSTYPREATHCLAPLMLLMAHSPESVSFTPKFVEFFRTLLNQGPTLVQRALGRGGVSGPELLLRLVLSQVEMNTYNVSVFPVWMHALWKIPAALSILDTAAMAARDWPALDSYAAGLLQDENAKEHVTNSVRFASTAPLLCECLLRAAHAREMNTHLFPALVTAVCQQRVAQQKIHVDNALQKINAKIPSEELIMYRCATAALSAPFHHPSHLTLWRLFMHMYLQRPPEHLHNSAPPGGPLFFSGLIKSRTLSQIKKRLQETAAYHHNEAESYKQETTPQSSNRVETIVTRDEDLLPTLTITDLTGEVGTECSESDSEGESEGSVVGGVNGVMELRRKSNMAAYHTAAEKLLLEYLRWLKEGEKVQALPHFADIARFIPEQALEEAWKHTLSSLRPAPSTELDTFPAPASPPSYPPPAPTTPLQVALNSIKSVKCRSMVRTRRTIMSHLEDINCKDSRALLSAVDKHLHQIGEFAREWSSEVSRISSLNSRLWELVAVLRVPRPLAPRYKQCSNNCEPLTFHLNSHEWCISIGAENGIIENRSAARAMIRRLARPRYHFARTATALHTIARRIDSPEAAVRVLDRAWRAAAHIAHCNSAQTALIALFDTIAERWITHKGKASELVSTWGSQKTSPLQQTLLGSLVAPRRMSPADWPALYTTLLNAQLPTHTIFSYLSRFEMSRWTEVGDPSQRAQILAALLTAAQRYGPRPESDTVLLELVGVHTAVLITAQELCAHVMKCARVSVKGTLPPFYWRHVIRAAERCAKDLTFDNLGHLLRDLGALWWEERSNSGNCERHASYAPYVAELLACLMRAFVAAAVTLSYEPERVGWYAWSAMLESWGAWLLPPSILPAAAPSAHSAHLAHSAHPAHSEHYAAMLQRFTATVRQVMTDCVGSEIRILQEAFEWAISTHSRVQSQQNAQEERIQMSAALAALAELPWTKHQWFYGTCLQKAAMVCTANDKELTHWCCSTFYATEADTLLRNVEESQLASRLAELLYLFTGTPYTNHQQLLEQATRLPWWVLPESALAEALDRFFSLHHNPAVAYHDLPQFTVILHASSLRECRFPQATRDARARCVSQWTGAAAAHALRSHRVAHAHTMLHTLTLLAPQLEDPHEMEELLCRAIVIFCTEPEPSTVLTVWRRWVCGAPGVCVRACAAAACALTSLQHAAPLADDAARAHLAHTEGGWNDIHRCWTQSIWKDPQLLIAHGSLHAGYACAIAHVHPYDARNVLAALQTAQINFIENETIVAVWICYAARIARECSATRWSATDAAELEECRHTARSLLIAWTVQPKRSLLQVVTLQADTDRSTPQHRLLIRLAECLLYPSSEAIQAYESACATLLGPNAGDVINWGKTPNPKRLVRLAVRLYPKQEIYFNWEMELAPEE